MADTTRNIFSLSEYSDSTIAGDGVPVDNVWLVADRADNGYIGGGYPGSTIMEKLTYATDGLARVPSADVTLSYGSNAAPISSAGAGYFVAGVMGSVSNPASVDRRSYVRKLSYATETFSLNSSPVPQSPSTSGQGPQGQGGASSPNFGYTGGGSGGGGGDEKSWVQKMAFASESWTILPNFSTSIHYQGDAIGNVDAGYWCGGSPSLKTMVQKVTYSSDTTSRSPSSDLPVPGRYFAGAGNATAGFLMGRGSSPTAHSSIIKFTYSTQTAALHPSNLTYAIKQSRGTGNLSKGYAAAGATTPGAWVSSISKLDYSTGTASNLSAKMAAGPRMDPLAVSARNDGITLPSKQEAIRWKDGAALVANYGVDFGGSSSSSYLNLGATTDFQWSGDFTLECWFNSDTISSNRGIFNLGAYNVSGGFELLTQSYSASTGFITLYGHDGNSAGVWIETPQGIISEDTWHHLAVVRSGTTITLYLDGTSRGTVTKSHTFGAGSNNSFTIGAGYAGGSYMEYFDGTMTNVRITKGQALYTSNFTPTTDSLTTTSQGATAGNVKLLCCNQLSVTGSTVTPGTITSNGTLTSTTLNLLSGITEPPAATPTSSTTPVEASTSNDGYYGGGNIAGVGYYSKFDKISYSTETTTSLPAAQASYGSNTYAQGSTSSQTEGWSNRNSDLYKLTYSTSTQSSSPAADLTFNPVGAASGFGYISKGYIVGGYSGGPLSTMNEITFATSTVGSAPNFAYSGYDRSSGTGNQTAGYLAGSIPGTTNAGKYVYATSTAVALPGKLSQARSESGATGNETNGYFSGCGNNGSGTRTDKVAYSTDTFTYIPGANLLKAVDGVAANSSFTAGYLNGGQSPAPGGSTGTSDVDKLTYSNETMSSLPSSADTAQARMHFMGFSARQYASGETMNVPSPNVI